MASHAPTRLSALEMLHFYLVALPHAVVKLVSQLLKRTLATGLSRKTFRRNMANSLGMLMTVFTVRELTAVQKRTTGDNVRAFCKEQKWSLESFPLKNTDGFAPATLHIIPFKKGPANNKRQTDRPVLLYFHGGAYLAPMKYMGMAKLAAEAVGARQLAILEYGLAPDCQYPGQLAQAVAALRFLTERQGNKYRSIVVAGESAGGNLALGLLAHMQQPHPRIRELPPPAEAGTGSLRALLAISPRTRNDASASSYTSNHGKDMLSRGSIDVISKAWKPEPEVWAAPDMGGPDFWKGLRAERVVLVAGSNEVYRDDIMHTAVQMGADDRGVGQSQVQLLVCTEESHIQCVVDQAADIQDGIMTRVVTSFLKEVAHQG